MEELLVLGFAFQNLKSLELSSNGEYGALEGLKNLESLKLDKIVTPLQLENLPRLKRVQIEGCKIQVREGVRHPLLFGPKS